jgi:hypothetical protein
MEAQLAQFTNRGMNQDISVSKATNEFAFKNYNIRITAVNDNTLLSVTNEKLPLNLKVQIEGQDAIPNRLQLVRPEGSSNMFFTLEYPAEEVVVFKADEETLAFQKEQKEIFITSKDVDNITIISPIEGKGNKYIYYVNTIPENNNINIDYIPGKYLGHSILGDTIVLFTKDTTSDYIITLKLNDASNGLIGEIKYKGDLNFSLEHLIETLPYYESESVQKVYWVDGFNQPRVINIAADNIVERLDTQFDFNPTITKFPDVTITKEYSGTGLFPAGVIQYFISYYNKFGAETGIVWASDLQYVTEYNRAIGPDENTVCSFKININNIDTTYEYARVYSMQRTSLNTTPICRIVGDININNSDTITIIDTNTNTETIDPTQLLFLGGDTFIASTLAQKDDTLFLGDLTIDNTVVPQEIKDLFTIEEGELASKYLSVVDFPRTTNDNRTFKRGEWYRIGIQFQDITTKWTVPVFIGDIQIPETIELPSIVFDLSGMLKDNSEAESKLSIYKNFRLVMVETNNSTRNILAQGIVTPTVFNHAERVNNSGPYSIASWIMRPRNGNAQFEHLAGLGNIVTKEGDVKKYINIKTCEIQNSLEELPIGSFSNGSELINNYYVDSSILNFYSPEIENNKSLFNDTSLKFRIIGVAPIDSSTSDIVLETSSKGYLSDSGLVKNSIFIPRSENEINSIKFDTFIRRPVYKDVLFNKEGVIQPNSAGKYFIYLWNKEDSLIGQTADSKKGDETLDIEYAKLSHKIIANKRTSLDPIYLTEEQRLNYSLLPTVFDSDVIESKVLNLSNEKSVIYQGNYDTLLTSRTEGSIGDTAEKEDFSYRVFFSEAKINSPSGIRPDSGNSSTPSNSRDSYTYTDVKQYSPVRIKYKTTPHITFALKGINTSDYKILPYLSSNNENPWDITNLYSSDYFNIPNTITYPWLDDGETYSQDCISNLEVNNPYLYIGEIYRDKTVNELYGEPTQNNLEKHNWIPISKSMEILGKDISMGYITRGDTYYQLWDCLSSYPFTEEDPNSVVDITSFYVETHINLDGRYDRHKNIDNILTVRKNNFNLINPVYSQSNNYFTYNILDEKFNQTKYSNQVAFSLQKTSTSEIDTWCNITLASSFNLNGLYGKLNKLVTVNDNIIAFQDKAISAINFNNRTALSTESGIPIEIANSGKVNGYSIISSNIGCQNKKSICEASSGVYFIDGYNKTMYGFNREGLANISSNGMSMWFKNNLTGNEQLFYDGLTNDVYITNDKDCLVYNEGLQSFTSFMDYSNIYSLFNFNGASILLDNVGNIIPKKMFGGDYTSKYSIEYKVNPEPYSYNTFTNVEYIADCLSSAKHVDDIPTEIKEYFNLPFDELEVWNEYQYGKTDIKERFAYPNFENKFRKWRVDIPRDEYSKNKLGRIKNPWILLKLNNTSNHDDKMVFHNLLVKYYK